MGNPALRRQSSSPSLGRLRASTGRGQALGWETQIQIGLAALARELPAGLQSDAEELFHELVSLHLLIVGASLQKAGSSHQLFAREHCEESLRSWTRRCASSAQPQWPALKTWIFSQDLSWVAESLEGRALPQLSAVSPSNSCLALVVGALLKFLGGIETTPGALVSRLGNLHQLLLTLRLSRLPEPAVQPRAGGAWLTVKEICVEPQAMGSGKPNKRTAQRIEAKQRLRRARTERESLSALTDLFPTGAGLASSGSWLIQPATRRRRAGAHYTPWKLCLTLIRRSLDPLLARLPEPRSQSILALKICDPAMGAGVFLVGTCHYLGEQLAAAWQREDLATDSPARCLARAQRLLAEQVLHGVDLDRHAVSLARLSLSELCGNPPGKESRITSTLLCGNAVVGRPLAPSENNPRCVDLQEVFTQEQALHWPEIYPQAFHRANAGFDALLGNPPWVSYVGRATQPLAPHLAAYHRRHNSSFQRYRTLHGLFVERCAQLLRMGGRLGLLLPTSVADLDGYLPTRMAHDHLCKVDSLLPDWSTDAFEGVFQPTMALLSTRSEGGPTHCPPGGAKSWPLKSPLTSTTEQELLMRLKCLPSCPPEMFGERGYQTHPADRAEMKKTSQPDGRFQLPLQQGGDLAEFQIFPPQLYVDPRNLAGRLRPTEQWQQVAIWIRQTSRFPIAALGNGIGFRNSILAAFESPQYPAALLLTYLNSTLVRWYHFSRHRDARQGMPQLKIGHLRCIPEFPPNSPERIALIEMGTRWGKRNTGLGPDERCALDEAVYNAFNISDRERKTLEQWRCAVPAPRSRRLQKANTPGNGGCPPHR